MQAVSFYLDACTSLSPNVAMPRHLLIVTESFPPFNAIASRRVASFAEHLGRFGWQPWVLTTQGDGPLPTSLPESRIERISVHPWIRRGIVGPPATDSVAEPAGLRKWTRRLKAGARSVAKTVIRGSGFRLNTYYPANRHWEREVRAQTPAILERLPRMNAVLGTYSPTAALRLAAHFAKAWDVPWLADFRDLAAHRPDRPNAISRYCDLRHERKLLRTATGIVTVGETLAEILRESHALPTWVVYNGWEDSDRSVLPTETNQASADDFPTAALQAGYLHYAGVLYPHRVEGFRRVFAAVANSGLHVVLRSLGPPELDRKLQQLAAQEQVGDRVHLLQACSPQQVQQEAALATGNLVIEDLHQGERAGKGTLTGKFLKLIALRRPVLAVAREDAELGTILNNTGCGRLCTSIDQIDDMLREIAQNARAFAGEEQAVREFSMVEQTRHLSHALDACCAVAALNTLPIPYRKAS